MGQVCSEAVFRNVYCHPSNGNSERMYLEWGEPMSNTVGHAGGVLQKAFWLARTP